MCQHNQHDSSIRTWKRDKLLANNKLYLVFCEHELPGGIHAIRNVQNYLSLHNATSPTISIDKCNTYLASPRGLHKCYKRNQIKKAPIKLVVWRIRFHTAFKNSLSRACFESRTVLAYVDLQIKLQFNTYTLNIKQIHQRTAPQIPYW